MGIKLTHLAGMTLSVVAAVAVVAPTANAQSVDSATPPTIPDALNDVVSESSGTFYTNRRFSRQAANMFGLGFRDREVLWDAATFSQEVEAQMLLQNTSDPTIRVPDLANPFTTTLLTMPSSQSPYLGTEFIFEPF